MHEFSANLTAVNDTTGRSFNNECVSCCGVDHAVQEIAGSGLPPPQTKLHQIHL
jgi:hypothetical protein